MNAMYSVEQVNIPPELGTVMKQFTKAVLRDRPENVYKYSANFFAVLSGRSAPFDQEGQLVEDTAGGASASKAQQGVASPTASVAAERGEQLKAHEAANEQRIAAAEEGAEGEEQHEEIYRGDDTAGMNDEDVVMAIFQKYTVGEEGMTTVELLPDMLADLRDALELAEDDLPPADEIVALLNCEDGTVDLLELKQLLFESEEDA